MSETYFSSLCSLHCECVCYVCFFFQIRNYSDCACVQSRQVITPSGGNHELQVVIVKTYLNENGYALAGKCERTCGTLITFLIFLFIVTLITACAQPSAIIVTLRCVSHLSLWTIYHFSAEIVFWYQSLNVIVSIHSRHKSYCRHNSNYYVYKFWKQEIVFMFTVICIHIGPWKSRKDLLLWECSLFFLELSVRQSMFEGRQARLESSLNRNSFGQIYLGFLIIEMS